MQELCAANSGFEDSSMYPPASGANNIMHHVVSVGFVLAAEPISGRFDAIYLLEILMPEPAADKGLFHLYGYQFPAMQAGLIFGV